MTQEKQTAFTQAYTHCQKRFERYCLALAYGKIDAQDLIQDVLLSTYERFEHIREKDQLLHYMIRAARNRSISQWRKLQFQTELQEKHTRELFAQGITPEMTLDVQLLYRTMEALPDKQREAIILFDICGFSLKEVAELQHSQINTVKSHLRRGRKKLQQLLADKPKSRWLAGLLIIPQDISKVGFGLFKQFVFQLKPITMYSLASVAVVSTFALVLTNKPSSTIQPKAVQPIYQSVAPAIAHKTVLQTASVIPSNTDVEVKNLRPEEPPLVDTPSLFRSNTSTLKLKSKASIFTKQSTPSIFSNQKLNLLPVTKPVVNKIAENCDQRVPHIDRIKTLKSRLLKKLKKDGLITSRQDKNKLTFQGNKVLVNGKLVPANLQERYLEFLKNYGITPCDQRMVATSGHYIAVGGMVGKRFKGQIQGKLDLAELGIE